MATEEQWGTAQCSPQKPGEFGFREATGKLDSHTSVIFVFLKKDEEKIRKTPWELLAS